MGGGSDRIFLPLAQLTMPEIVDYHMPPEGVFHNLVFVSIRKEFARLGELLVSSQCDGIGESFELRIAGNEMSPEGFDGRAVGQLDGLVGGVGKVLKQTEEEDANLHLR